MASAEAWVASKLEGLDCVRSAKVQRDGLIVVDRLDAPDALLSVSNLARVEARDVAEQNDSSGDIGFFLNVPKHGVWDGGAIDLIEYLGKAFGGLGDAYRALRHGDVRGYVNPERRHVERILSQHSKVRNFTRRDNKVYELERRGMQPVSAYIALEYEVTAEAVRTALELHGHFDVYVSSDPNVRDIAQATLDALASTEVDLRLWPAFMSDLHREWT